MSEMARTGARPVSARETRRRIALEGRSITAFARGDVMRALELGEQAARILRREHAEYDRNHPNAPRYGTPMDDE